MEGSSTGYHIDATTRWLRISRLFQIRLSRLMVLIAIAGVLMSASIASRPSKTTGTSIRGKPLAWS
jgi:hypothetical protein